MTLAPVPSLEELLERPDRARELTPEAAAALLARVTPVQTLLLVQAFAVPAAGNGQRNLVEDRLLSVAEAARALGLSKDHLYRHANKYPFTVRLGSRLRFSARGIERYIRQRQGRRE